MRTSIFKNWNKPVYIASRTTSGLDDYGNEIINYSTPKKYIINVQPTSGFMDATIYGERVSKMQKAIVDMKYQGAFHEGDVAYLNGATPTGEAKNGMNANYVITNVSEQNLKIAIYFDKLQK